MRKTIVDENTTTPSGYFLNPGCIDFNSKIVYPLMYTFGGRDTGPGDLVGTFTDVQREGTAITAEFTFFNDHVDLTDDDLYDLSFYGTRVEHKDNDKKSVTFARLRAVTVVPKLVSKS